jgi:hypothetical protein
MRNSNKILLIAAAAVLAFILVFVIVMGTTVRDLIEKRGRTVQASGMQTSDFQAGRLPQDYCLPEAANTFDLSC